MCGINGFNFRDKERIDSMNQSLVHRGPDGQSAHLDDEMTLGHCRLSIIDLSLAGSQPMLYTRAGRKIYIVFNGEVYNYIELRERLKSRGYTFLNNTDTEVIMAAYLEWGEACVNEFNGMWAFCIYDTSKQLLFCSRDRLGVKPFYYYLNDNKFIFSSELKGILANEDLQINSVNNIDKDAVELYFSLGYVPAPRTIYKSVYKLESATNLLFCLTQNKILSKYTYYNIPKKDVKSDKQELIEEGKSLLLDSVGLRMRSDVPVGAFLSGGLDSSAVVANMRHFTELENLHTFSIGFEDKKYDETQYINIVKDYFGTQHHHHIYNEDDFREGWSEYVENFDEPFGDYSSFPSYKVCQLAQGHVKVVLSGDGGDEIFGGYPLYNTGHIFDLLLKIPKTVRRAMLKGSNLVKIADQRLIKARELVRLSLLEKKDFHTEMFASERFKPAVYGDYCSGKLSSALEIADNNLSEALRIYDLLHNTLANNYLVKVDRTSMANSIEVRSPFLDYRFIEFAQSIPANLKVNSMDNKILMKEIIRDLVPKEILNRKKMGFTPPIHNWLYQSVSESEFKVYCGYLKDFSSELYDFYSKIIYSEVKSYMKDSYLIKLAIFGKWFEYWILSEVVAKFNGSTVPQSLKN